MIPRYARKEVSELFSDESRFALFLEVEILAVEALSRHGVVPEQDARRVRERAPVIDARFVEKVEERERETNHDVAAFVDTVQDAIGGKEATWIHYGLTSTDVVDTALSATLVKAVDLLIHASDRLVDALKTKAKGAADVAMLGRTHGMHAEPTTLGAKLTLFCLQADRDRERLRRARAAIAVGKLSGAVGTYSNIDPAIESEVCDALGLVAVRASQVLARDRHAEFVYALTSTTTTIEAIATEIRHLQRSEVGEVEEPFTVGQKGSSAMPHKRNPVVAERLVGLARVMRGYLVAAFEDVALWHERDISHSSVERIVLPDASMIAYYCLTTMTRLVEGLVVHKEKMLENLLQGSLGLVFSQPVLLGLVDAGIARDDAYRIVQRAAQRASNERTHFREILEHDEEVTRVVGSDSVSEVLDRAFDLDRALRHVPIILSALEEVS